MTAVAQGEPVRLRWSKAALTSLITGLLSCVPLMGLLAILTGLIGFFTAGRPGMKGRWMAVVGFLLGLIGTCGWGVAGLTAGGIFAVFQGTEPPRTATRAFLENVDKGDLAAARGQTTGDYSEKDLQELALTMKDGGRLSEVSFSGTEISNDTAEVRGTATFTDAGGGHNSADLEGRLRREGNEWKVREVTLTPKWLVK